MKEKGMLRLVAVLFKTKKLEEPQQRIFRKGYKTFRNYRHEEVKQWIEYLLIKIQAVKGEQQILLQERQANIASFWKFIGILFGAYLTLVTGILTLQVTLAELAILLLGLIVQISFFVIAPLVIYFLGEASLIKDTQQQEKVSTLAQYDWLCHIGMNLPITLSRDLKRIVKQLRAVEKGEKGKSSFNTLILHMLGALLIALLLGVSAVVFFAGRHSGVVFGSPSVLVLLIAGGIILKQFKDPRKNDGVQTYHGLLVGRDGSLTPVTVPWSRSYRSVRYGKDIFWFIPEDIQVKEVEEPWAA
jgi:hypothetical protein